VTHISQRLGFYRCAAEEANINKASLTANKYVIAVISLVAAGDLMTPFTET